MYQNRKAYMKKLTKPITMDQMVTKTVEMTEAERINQMSDMLAQIFKLVFKEPIDMEYVYDILDNQENQ
jgi:hypothetical protein